jgi:hypothetical protein
MTHGERRKMPSWEASIRPANNPPKPKEKVNDVSLNISQKLFEVPAWDIGYCLLQVIKEYGKEQTKREEKWKKSFDVELIDLRQVLGELHGAGARRALN